MIVATLLETPSSTCFCPGIGVNANTPGVVLKGGTTRNDVANDSNGSCIIWAVIMPSPAEQPGPPKTATVALPSASSVTVMPRPLTPFGTNGLGMYQVSFSLHWL